MTFGCQRVGKTCKRTPNGRVVARGCALTRRKSDGAKVCRRTRRRSSRRSGNLVLTPRSLKYTRLASLRKARRVLAATRAGLQKGGACSLMGGMQQQGGMRGGGCALRRTKSGRRTCRSTRSSIVGRGCRQITTASGVKRCGLSHMMQKPQTGLMIHTPRSLADTRRSNLRRARRVLKSLRSSQTGGYFW